MSDKFCVNHVKNRVLKILLLFVAVSCKLLPAVTAGATVGVEAEAVAAAAAAVTDDLEKHITCKIFPATAIGFHVLVRVGADVECSRYRGYEYLQLHMLHRQQCGHENNKQMLRPWNIINFCCCCCCYRCCCY